jgi:cobalamin-dependent methionine synthase I
MDVEREIWKHLGYPTGEKPDAEVSAMIARALDELSTLAEFRYLHAEYTVLPDFLRDHEGYSGYLSGADSVVLCATTLGAGIDRRVQRLQLTEMAYAVVFNTAAGVWLEECADQYEKRLPYPPLGFRFCPGYNGTPLSDAREIARLLRAERIGITFLDSGLMVPSKSMVGVMRVGGSAHKSCAGCVAADACRFRQQGRTCYDSER